MNQKEEKIIDRLKKLSKRQQMMSLWLLYHIDILELIASGREMTQMEEQTMMERAEKEGDDILITMVQYKRLKDQQNRE